MGPTTLPYLTISCRYRQMTEDWFINIACTWQVPPGPTAPIRSGHRDPSDLILGSSCSAWSIFSSAVYQGESHAEWPKERHEHAPTQTGGVTCRSPKAVDTEYRPPAVARVAKRPKKLRAISRVSPGRSAVGERRCGGELLPTRRTLLQIDVFEPRSDLENVAATLQPAHATY